MKGHLRLRLWIVGRATEPGNADRPAKRSPTSTEFANRWLNNTISGGLILFFKPRIAIDFSLVCGGTFLILFWWFWWFWWFFLLMDIHFRSVSVFFHSQTIAGRHFQLNFYCPCLVHCINAKVLKFTVFSWILNLIKEYRLNSKSMWFEEKVACWRMFSPWRMFHHFSSEWRIFAPSLVRDVFILGFWSITRVNKHVIKFDKVHKSSVCYKRVQKWEKNYVFIRFLLNVCCCTLFSSIHFHNDWATCKSFYRASISLRIMYIRPQFCVTKTVFIYFFAE